MKKCCLHQETLAFLCSSPFSAFPYYLGLSKQQQTLPGLGSENGTMKVQSFLCLLIPDAMYFRDQRTLWWNRILIGASLTGSVTRYQIIPHAVALEQALHMASCCLGTFPGGGGGEVPWRDSRCCHVGCGQHSGGLKYLDSILMER